MSEGHVWARGEGVRGGRRCFLFRLRVDFVPDADSWSLNPAGYGRLTPTVNQSKSEQRKRSISRFIYLMSAGIQSVCIHAQNKKKLCTSLTENQALVETTVSPRQFFHYTFDGSILGCGQKILTAGFSLFQLHSLSITWPKLGFVLVSGTFQLKLQK